MPAAVRGVLDLRNWDFTQHSLLKLDGEWEFCPGCSINPSDFAQGENRKGCGFIQVPGLWKGRTVNGLVIPGEGAGTYRLKILSGPDKKAKVLILHRVFSAYSLWINGALVDTRGRIDRNSNVAEDYIFVHNRRYYSFTPEEGDNEIVLQVFNYGHGSGGIDRSILLEDEEAALAKRFYGHTVDMVVFGLLLFAAVYNILFFFFRRNDLVSLYFGLACLMMAVNTLNHQFPLLSGNFMYPGNPYFVNYFTVLVAVLFFQMTVRSLFPDDFSAFFTRVSVFAPVGFIVPLFFLGFGRAEQMMKGFFVFVIVFVLYDTYVLLRALIQRRDNALLFLAGFAPCLLGIVNDVLYALWIVDTTNVAQIGGIVICITTTIIISRKFAGLLGEVEELSRDLAEKNESLRKMDQVKDRFLAATSHELRTPLHGMIGLSESMIEGATGDLPRAALENLSLIATSGHRLAGMVNDLLDMGKIQEDELSLTLRPVSMRLVSEAVVKLSLPLIGERSLGIINSINPGLPAVLADDDRVRQVLYNLVGNAIKFTGRGTIELSARVVPRDDGEVGEAETDAMLEVSVSDTGIGVPEQFRETIFEAYRQVDEGDTRAYAGTGLGLTIAKRIIELHGGTIRMEPGETGGSVFSFTLPLSRETLRDYPEVMFVESMDSATHPAGALGHSGYPYGDDDGFFEGRPSILVVDDDPVNVRMLRNYLESKRCMVKTANDGIAALDTIDADGSIDLVLLDIMMPVMSGYEVCRRIREKRGPEDLPVIMLTAKNRMSDIDAAFEAGANDYIVKPFLVRELFARAGAMLRLKNVRKPAAMGITVRSGKRLYSLTFREIVYITSHSKNIVIHALEGDIELPVMMKEIIHRLPPDIFVRIHKSHIINLGYLHSVSHVLSGRYRVRLKDADDTELPVGPAYLESLREKM